MIVFRTFPSFGANSQQVFLGSLTSHVNASLGASRHPLASLQQLQDELRSAGGRSPSELFGRVAVVDVGHVAAMFVFFFLGDVSHTHNLIDLWCFGVAW